MKQLTYRDRFSDTVAEDINKDYPGQAIVKDGKCYITNEYWIMCKNYVLEKCNIPDISRERYVKKTKN